MTIVWITPGFRADERDWFIPALYNLALRVHAACDLHVVALRYPPRRGTYTVGGIRVHALGKQARGLVGMASEWSAAAAIVRRLRPDLVHAYWVLNSGLIAAGFARRLPVLITAAGGEVVNLTGIGYGEAGHARTRALLRWAMTRATAVGALSESYAAQIRRFLGGAPVLCTPWGIIPGDWAEVTPDLTSKAILSVGSLEPVKGLEILIDAYAQVCRRIPEARLLLVGDGTQRALLTSRATALGCAGGVEVTGWVTHRHMPGIYAGAGLYAQASHFESQGMAVLEAAACGLPIAGTDVGVLSELAPDAAVATTPAQPDSLANALLELLLDRKRSATLGECARQLAVGKFGVERVARELLALYTTLAG